MRRTRRDLLRTTGVALGGVGLAGCNGSPGDAGSTASPTDADEATDAPTGTDAPSDGSTASAELAVAAEWNTMRARIYDALALGRTGRYAGAAAVVGDVFARFENAEGEWGAHEQLEATNADTYEAFEGNLDDLRSAFEAGTMDGAESAAVDAEANLLAAQRGRTSADVAEAFTLVVYASRVRNVGALAATGETDAAAAVGQSIYADFEEAAVHDTLESASQELYDGFEGGLETAISAAQSGDADAVQTQTAAASTAVVDAAYELVSDRVAGVGHLSLMGAAGFDAESLARVGGPGVDYAHAAALNIYRARVRDAAWLSEAGEQAAAKAATQAIIAHFEGARAHEALEEANHDAYVTFEHEGLEALVPAIEAGDDAAVADAVSTVHDGLTAGIETLAGADAALLESGYFRARLGDARERYDLGEAEAAATVAEDLFARFESDEAGFHERLEEASEDLYHTFEEEHLAALPDAFRSGDDAAVETHLSGALTALVDFEASAGSTATVSGAAATYLSGRALDAGVRATLGDSERAATVASDAFAHFEAGAGGFHEAVEEASEERYHAFEEALGAVRSAATDEADAFDAATTVADEATAAVYAVVEASGGGTEGAASALMSGVFAAFEEARVHEALEEADHEAYEAFEAALSAYVSALESGENVDAAAEAFAQSTRTAAFAVAGAAGKAPAGSASDGESGGDGSGEESEVTGGPNVVEGVPDGADHVVDVTAVAYEPAELTVQVGDTVAWRHAGGEAHTVTAVEADLPEGATYWASGGFESESAARIGWESSTGGVASGHAYVNTFETAGTHPYVCVPHEAAGMTGRVVVEA